MNTVAILFWICLALVIYTYAGYGIVLWVAVKIRERLFPRREAPAETQPEVTLLIAAYNEQDCVDAKMGNCRALHYPSDRLHIVWVTDGSDDQTVERLGAYPEARVLHEARRSGKTAALNRAMPLIDTPIVVFTDANTMLNTEAIAEIVRPFNDPNVGCVAGEKRVAADDEAGTEATEGLYWRYESTLKSLDARLFTAVGAAGELYALRRELWQTLPQDTLLDDFVCSMRIAAAGHRIAYRSTAYALENPSADMHEEGKRKRRIAAGGLQSVWRLRNLLNPLRRPTLWFQYVSHRVLRWTLTPVALAALIPLNVALLFAHHPTVYIVLMVGQALFYGSAAAGWSAAHKGRRAGVCAVTYYFVFMNFNIFRGVAYLIISRHKGTWDKARRR